MAQDDRERELLRALEAIAAIRPELGEPAWEAIHKALLEALAELRANGSNS